MKNFSRRDVSRLFGLGVGAGLIGAPTLAQAASGKDTKTASGNSALALDHIVWAVPDLDAAIKSIHDLTGVAPVSGGKAPGREQSHNALFSLGGGSYFEIFSPSRAGSGGRWAEAVQDGRPHIVSYALRVTDRFERLRSSIAAAGYTFTGPRAMGRVRPDGGAVNWELLNVKDTPLDDALPFFIDWLESKPHPSQSSPAGITIASFEVAHPRAGELQAIYKKLGIGTAVVGSDRQAFSLSLNTPKGKVWLS